MGFSTVAVLHNDFIHEMEDDTGRIGKDMARAIRGIYRRKEDRLATDFHVGKVISMDHASGTQVVLVKHGTGVPIHEAEHDQSAVWRMREYLERHGYKVVKRRKTKAAA